MCERPALLEGYLQNASFSVFSWLSLSLRWLLKGTYLRKNTLFSVPERIYFSVRHHNQHKRPEVSQTCHFVWAGQGLTWYHLTRRSDLQGAVTSATQIRAERSSFLIFNAACLHTVLHWMCIGSGQCRSVVFWYFSVWYFDRGVNIRLALPKCPTLQEK